MNPPGKTDHPSFEGPRQLAPAMLGRHAMSRHTAMLSGPKSRYFWLFLKNPRFWSIASVVTAVFLAVFWSVKDLPALSGVDWSAIKAAKPWQQTFFFEDKPARVEGGKVIEPHEKYYTVPSELKPPQR